MEHGITLDYKGGRTARAGEPCEFCGSTDLTVKLTFTGERFKRAKVWQFEFVDMNGHTRLILPRVIAPNMVKTRRRKGAAQERQY